MFKLVFPQTCFLITAVTMSVINVCYENNLRWVSKKQVTHTFNGPFSGTTQVSQYQKGKTQSGFY